MERQTSLGEQPAQVRRGDHERCGFADTTNTGVPAGTSLVDVPGQITAPEADGSTGRGWSWDPRGWIVLNAGGLLTSVRVAGNVNLAGDNATVKSSDITVSGANSYGVQLLHANDATIEHNNIHGSVQTSPAANPQWCDSGIRDIYGDSESLTAENNNISWCATGMNNILNGGLIQQNYIHDNGFGSSDDHTNGIQFEPGSGQLMIVRNNTILNPLSQTDDIILSNDGGGTETNRLIDHNLLGGGGYCFYGTGGPSLDASNITFTNNHFSRISYRTCGFYGPATHWQPGNGDVWSSNVWDDTGAAVKP